MEVSEAPGVSDSNTESALPVQDSAVMSVRFRLLAAASTRCSLGELNRHRRSGRRFSVGGALRDLRQQLIGMFLFLEIMLKEPGGVVLAELIGPGDQRTIAGDLVMFDSLSRTDDAGIEDNVVLDVRHMLFGLSQNPFDRIAFLATRGRVDKLEHP
jgi:hypothetical protein